MGRPVIDDELPPCLGERYRDVTADLYRHACNEIENEEEPHEVAVQPL